MKQKIVTPGGETLGLLPLAEYERLVDAADIVSADRIKSDIAAGRDEMIPAEIVNRILSGENPVRVWRQHRGLSARDLAEKTGLSAAYISEIETGKKDGSVSAMKRIAEILHMDIDDLVYEISATVGGLMVAEEGVEPSPSRVTPADNSET